jgi:hypothetical protein
MNAPRCWRCLRECKQKMSYSKLNSHNYNFLNFEVTADEQIIIKKSVPADIAYLKSLEFTLNEWNSENDEEDYCDL